MKKLLSALIAFLFLSSCCSRDDARDNIDSEFPNNKKVIQNGWRFYVIDSSNVIWDVRCLNSTNDNISYKKIIYRFKCN